MNLYAPKYYSQFKCIADKCQNNCCVGWEIDIDTSTLGKYRTLKLNGRPIIDSIEISDTPHFRMLPDGRCPHLNECGLCDIINEHGEALLSEICREHPRFYNYTSAGCEVGLGLVCEEAARIVISSDDYTERIVVSVDDNRLDSGLPDNKPIIDKIYGVLSKREIAYQDRLQMIYDMVGVSPAVYTDDYLVGLLLSCELFDPSHASIFSTYSSSISQQEKYEQELERFLAYLIYRHVTSAESETDIRSSLGFAFVLERLLASIIKNEKVMCREDVYKLASAISLELEYSEENTDLIKFEFAI